MLSPLKSMTFSVWTEFKVPTGKRSEHPRGMPLVARLLISSGAGVGTNGILECKFLSKNGHLPVNAQSFCCQKDHHHHHHLTKRPHNISPKLRRRASFAIEHEARVVHDVPVLGVGKKTFTTHRQFRARVRVDEAGGVRGA
jgi:hypothetical protein